MRRDNPRRDWGLPEYPSTPPRKDIRTDDDGCRATAALLGLIRRGRDGDEPSLALLLTLTSGAAIVALLLLILWVDLHHQAAPDAGTSGPGYVVVTPVTYGPPPR
jgi:hypothetical protein